jgi:hypothetical protein
MVYFNNHMLYILLLSSLFVNYFNLHILDFNRKKVFYLLQIIKFIKNLIHSMLNSL